MLKMTSGFAAENPKLTILSVITFSVGIFVLGLMTNFTLDTGDQLWTPKGSKPVQVCEYGNDVLLETFSL